MKSTGCQSWDGDSTLCNSDLAKLRLENAVAAPPPGGTPPQPRARCPLPPCFAREIEKASHRVDLRHGQAPATEMPRELQERDVLFAHVVEDAHRGDIPAGEPKDLAPRTSQFALQRLDPFHGTAKMPFKKLFQNINGFCLQPSAPYCLDHNEPAPQSETQWRSREPWFLSQISRRDGVRIRPGIITKVGGGCEFCRRLRPKLTNGNVARGARFLQFHKKRGNPLQCRGFRPTRALSC